MNNIPNAPPAPEANAPVNNDLLCRHVETNVKRSNYLHAISVDQMRPEEKENIVDGLLAQHKLEHRRIYNDSVEGADVPAWAQELQQNFRDLGENLREEMAGMNLRFDRLEDAVSQIQRFLRGAPETPFPPLNQEAAAPKRRTKNRRQN